MSYQATVSPEPDVILPKVPTAMLSDENARAKQRWTFRNWFLSTSLDKLALAEANLLSRGGIDLHDTKHVRHEMVVLDSKFSRENCEINTLVVDQQGFASSQDEALATAEGLSRNNIIVLHGYAAGLGCFYRNLLPLSQKAPNSRVYALDWLGMGRSSRPPFPMYNASNDADEQFNKAVDFFLESFEDWRKRQPGLEKFVLSGHSMGGYLATLYALKHPHRVKKLILNSPVGIPECPKESTIVTGHQLPRFITWLWNRNYTPMTILRFMGPFSQRLVQGYTRARMNIASEVEQKELSDYFYHISVARGSGEYALAAILAPGAWARVPLCKKFSQLTVPTTFIYGQYDWMDYRHAEEAAASMNVPYKIIQISNADHHLHVDNYEEYNDVLARESS